MESSAQHDLPQQLLQSVRLLGFPSLTEFTINRAQSSFEELAEELGRRFAPIHFEKLLRDEVRTEDDYQYFARLMLVQQLRRKCPRGWRVHKEFDLILAIASWASGLDKASRT
jgi:hypothetical protein